MGPLRFVKAKHRRNVLLFFYTLKSFAAGHMMSVIRVYDAAGNVIETHEHARAISRSPNFFGASLGCNLVKTEPRTH